MKRFLFTYSINNRLVSVDIEAFNMWEAMVKFDALDVSVDEVINVTTVPFNLKPYQDKKYPKYGNRPKTRQTTAAVSRS